MTTPTAIMAKPSQPIHILKTGRFNVVTVASVRKPVMNRVVHTSAFKTPCNVKP